MPTIRIDDQVYEWLQKQARPFEDTPNSVLRRIARLDNQSIQSSSLQNKDVSRSRRISSRDKTPQGAFRKPIISILKKHGGKADRMKVLKELETIMSDQLTEFDKADISSGTVRWQKSAEWEVRIMREQGILKEVHEEPRGVWALRNEFLK